MMQDYYIHPTAEVEPGARIGTGTRIWRWTHIRSQAIIGCQCIIGQGVYIESHVRIGSRVKIQNGVSLFDGVSIEDGVFIGPHVCFTNDLYPRAITVNGELKTATDWSITPTVVKHGASLGASTVVVCGTVIGEFALVGAGSVVTHDVAPHSLVYGNPARCHGYVCYCAQRLVELEQQDGQRKGWCPICNAWCTFPLYLNMCM